MGRDSRDHEFSIDQVFPALVTYHWERVPDLKTQDRHR